MKRQKDKQYCNTNHVKSIHKEYAEMFQVLLEKRVEQKAQKHANCISILLQLTINTSLHSS